MMRRALRTAFLAGAFLLMPSSHANYEAGQQAWDAGHTDEALAEWQAAAGSGDRRAMRALGRAYLRGLGVLQDYVEAHKWFNLAASRGDAEAAAERDALAEKMTSEKVAQAQALARAWRPSESRGPAASRVTTTPAVSPAAKLVEETLTPTRELPSDTGTDRASTDSPDTIETPSPTAVVMEETSTPTRDPVPDADSPPSRPIRPGDIIQDCAQCPQMVLVPAGEYLMGSPDSESERFSGEGPMHPVTIGEPFAVGVYEVTFEEWDACVRSGGCAGYRPHDERWGRGERPVINVSWTDAQSYVEWLSGRTGKEYREVVGVVWTVRGPE